MDSDRLKCGFNAIFLRFELFHGFGLGSDRLGVATERHKRRYSIGDFWGNFCCELLPVPETVFGHPVKR